MSKAAALLETRKKQYRRLMTPEMVKPLTAAMG
jgi:hypothetical protein